VDGVDEGDIVKTDGQYVYTFSTRNGYSNYQLVITKVTPAADMAVVARVQLREFQITQVREMFVSGGRLLLLAHTTQTVDLFQPMYSATSSAKSYYTSANAARHRHRRLSIPTQSAYQGDMSW
jgi:hypothetical protein